MEDDIFFVITTTMSILLSDIYDKEIWSKIKLIQSRFIQITAFITNQYRAIKIVNNAR